MAIRFEGPDGSAADAAFAQAIFIALIALVVILPGAAFAPVFKDARADTLLFILVYFARLGHGVLLGLIVVVPLKLS